MTACFFIPSIAPSMPACSNGFFSPSSSLSTFGLSHFPLTSPSVREAEKALYVLGGRGERGAVARRRDERARARL